jgi:hypothetical protein
MLRNLLDQLRSAPAELRLPSAARDQRARDRKALDPRDPGIDRVVDEGLAWLARAQDNSTTRDGGVARDYSLISGWSSSYPETTGYIVPTLIDCGTRRDNPDLLRRARAMLDWLAAIQLPQGGFQGGRIDASPVVPVTFNTGQILLGLAAGAKVFGIHRDAMRRAADWLVETQDADGCWRRHPTPFAKPGEKTYDTHVAWGLLEAARLEPEAPYARRALAHVRWALTKQRRNGWFENCCLSHPDRPLTHTLGYALRGILEAYRYSNEQTYLDAALLTADRLVRGLREDGHLAGRFFSDWRPAADWVCLTGSVQIAYCWLMIYGYTGDARYRDAAFRVNAFVRRTVNIDGPPELRGGVKGSHPVDGPYGQYQYLNWAVKFSIDSQLLEQDIRSAEPAKSQVDVLD